MTMCEYECNKTLAMTCSSKPSWVTITKDAKRDPATITIEAKPLEKDAKDAAYTFECEIVSRDAK